MNNLRLLRKKMKKTQQQLADFLGITQQGYACYENETRIPPTDMTIKLADYFGVSVDYLLGREEKSPVNNGEDGAKALTIPEKYSGIRVALNDGDKNLTQDDIDDIVRFIEFTANKNKK